MVSPLSSSHLRAQHWHVLFRFSVHPPPGHLLVRLPLSGLQCEEPGRCRGVVRLCQFGLLLDLCFHRVDDGPWGKSQFKIKQYLDMGHIRVLWIFLSRKPTLLHRGGLITLQQHCPHTLYWRQIYMFTPRSHDRGGPCTQEYCTTGHCSQRFGRSTRRSVSACRGWSPKV